MKNLHQNIRQLVEIYQSQDKTSPQYLQHGWHSWQDDALNDHTLILTPEVRKIVSKVQISLFESISDHDKKFKDQEKQRDTLDSILPALAVAPIMATIEEGKIEECINNLAAEIESNLQMRLLRATPREISFGCTLFNNSNIDGFSIGPVRFEAKTDWLKRKFMEGSLTREAYDEFMKKWHGKHFDEKSKFANPSGEFLTQSSAIPVAIGNCEFVCSVQTKGLGEMMAREKSIAAAQLAITSIALIFLNNTPDNIPRQIKDMRILLDQTIPCQEILVSCPDTLMTCYTIKPRKDYGVDMNNERWKKYLNFHSKYFELVSEVLNYHTVSSTPDDKREEILNCMLLAMIWFQKGLWEDTNFIAVVNFAAVLDTLSGGKKSRGIKKMLQKILGLDLQSEWGYEKINKTVNDLYDIGRSRTIHGSNKATREDWTERRQRAELLSAWALNACMKWVAEHPECNDPKEMSK